MCSECCAGTYLTNKSCPAPSESVSPVSPVRPNRECRRFPTRVASVSAVCGMLSLRASMQVNGRCAADGNQDVIFPPYRAAGRNIPLMTCVCSTAKATSKLLSCFFSQGKFHAEQLEPLCGVLILDSLKGAQYMASPYATLRICFRKD